MYGRNNMFGHLGSPVATVGEEEVEVKEKEEGRSSMSILAAATKGSRL